MKITPPSFLLFWLAAAGLLAAPTRAQSTTRASVDSFGVQANHLSHDPSVSADGRYAAFWSNADNLVPGDTNGARDVFVHDRQTGQTSRASVDSLGGQGNDWSYDPSISADGRYVAFESFASNLVPGDTNGVTDVFVHDRLTGQTTRASVDSLGGQGNRDSAVPVLSADGRYVAFRSFAANLVSGDTNGHEDVFVHDRSTGQTSRASVDSFGVQGNDYSRSPFLSADGRYVAFRSKASNLVPGDTNGAVDVFVHDLQTGQTSRASVDSFGVQGNDYSRAPSLSGDGRYVAFTSEATNLIPGDTNNREDVFVHDRQTGQTSRASVDSFGGQGNGNSFDPAISADGRYLAFESWASNLVPGDTNDSDDVFVHDRQTGQTSRASVASSGDQGNGQNGGGGLSDAPAISPDGRYVVFHSADSNLVPGDTNSQLDIFVHDRLGPSLTKAGVCPGSVTFTASGVMSRGDTAFVWGSAGSFVVPAGYPCAGTPLNLVPSLTPNPSYSIVKASSSAIASLLVTAAEGSCGTLVMQAVDLGTCATTNTMSF